MKRLWMMLILVCAAGGYTPSFAQSTPVRSADSTAAWRDDLHVLVDHLQRMHPDLYRWIDEAAFTALVDDVETNIPTMTDAQIIVEMMRCTASIQDGHTAFFPAFQTDYPFNAYPLLFFEFDDGVYLIDAPDDAASAIGSRLVQVGGHPVSEVLAQIMPLLPHDNASGQRILIPVNLVTTEILLGTGLIDDPDHPDFVVETREGTRRTLNPVRIPMGEYIARFPAHYRFPANPQVMSWARLDDVLWWEPLPDSHTLYVQYNAVETLGTAWAGFQAAFSAPEIDRVILDLRYNGGGDIHTAAAFVRLLENDPRLQQPNRLIVLIGRSTFSAALVVALDLEQTLHPVFIGESSGGRPLMFENARPITLPNSQLQVYIATRARHDVDAGDTRDAIVPAVSIPVTAADYFADQDAALTAAEAYPMTISTVG